MEEFREQSDEGRCDLCHGRAGHLNDRMRPGADCGRQRQHQHQRERQGDQQVPALHRLRRGRLRRQVVQPARLRRASSRPPTSWASSSRRSSRTASNDFAPNLTSLVARAATLIVTVGFALAAATKESAKANPDIEYVLIDDAADGGADGNDVRRQGRPAQHQADRCTTPLRRRSSPATRLPTTPRPARSAPSAAPPSRPSRSSWTASSRASSTTTRRRASRSRSSAGTARTAPSPVASRPTTRPPTPPSSIIDQDVDVILPVGGPIYQGAITAIRDSGKDIAMLGVDADLYETDPTTQTYVLTSILKSMKVVDLRGGHGGGPGQVRLRRRTSARSRTTASASPPFHNFESQGLARPAGASSTRSRPASSTGRSRSPRTSS